MFQSIPAKFSFKPMLSASLDDVDLNTLKYPLLASPKLDGVRCLMIDGVAYSRNLKPIRNEYVQRCLAGLNGLDGELIVGSAVADGDGEVLGRTQSGVMSKDGEPDFKYYVFDTWTLGGAFADRLTLATEMSRNHPFIVAVPHKFVYNAQELIEYELQCLAAGYEGVMLRDPNGPYKQGRSTLREGHLMKLKRFIDGEAVVVDIEEARENTNELETDNLGHAKRSKHQENLVGKGMVGTIIVLSEQHGRMRLAPGIMKHDERIKFFKNPMSLIDSSVHWRAFGYGQKDTPRFPRFYGIREDV